MRYKTKPCEIEAVQWTGYNMVEIEDFVSGSLTFTPLDIEGKYELYINTLEGVMKASDGDYIIRGLRGEYYPCKPDVFAKKYELV